MPWNLLVKFAARRYGVINPLDILAKMRSFAQPSEIGEPIELLRAGILFHARGLINTRAIQHNLDWIWPFWVEKQFNPNDPSFIPRGFSFSHINLTHRNWTAVGHPDLSVYPLVDPRGLVTPLYDGWSLDFWIIEDKGDSLFKSGSLFPSKNGDVDQQLEMTANLSVKTICRKDQKEITTSVQLLTGPTRPVLEIAIDAKTDQSGWLVVALRPYNPEGIEFIDNIYYEKSLPAWRVNKTTPVLFSEVPEKVVFSNYQHGDAVHHLKDPGNLKHIECKVGMATAAALFPIAAGTKQTLKTHVPLDHVESTRAYRAVATSGRNWKQALQGTAGLSIPDKKIEFTYNAAMRTLLLLSSYEVVPGPYTYNRFWFRDACLMLHALLVSGCINRAQRLLDKFPARQKLSGYFQSQEGEWDSNGQVLWIMERFFKLSGQPLKQEWLDAIFSGADWIQKKRVMKTPEARHHGLLPAGFSAEHFGPNDHYFWDDFWGLAGFNAAARLAGHHDDISGRHKYAVYARDLENAIFTSIEKIPEQFCLGCIPASPYRRMDSGAIGSLVADYPLRLTERGNLRIMKTVDYLIDNCFCKDGFFQDMIHSGINPYLTLSIAQTLLRNNDDRFQKLIQVTADFASSTGQWPEAIHPATGGGCMGDGQHGWAAAEWIMMIRNLFVREEDNQLVIGAGIFPEWMAAGDPISFGPSPTPYGAVSVKITHAESGPVLTLETAWRDDPPEIAVEIPGYLAVKRSRASETDEPETYQLEKK